MEENNSSDSKVRLSPNVVRVDLSKNRSGLYHTVEHKYTWVANEALDTILHDGPDQLHIIELRNRLLKSNFLTSSEFTFDLNANLQRYRKRIESVQDAFFEIRFVASYVCDEKCSYCLVSEIAKECDNLFDVRWIHKAIEIIEKAIELSYVPVKGINITLIGGEPLLDINWNINKAFISGIRTHFEKKYPINVRVITNGNRVSHYLLKELKQNCISEMYFSYDMRGEGESDTTQPESRLNREKLIDRINVVLRANIRVILDLKIGKNTVVSETNETLVALRNITQNDNRLKILASNIVSTQEYDPLQHKHVGRFSLILLKKEGCLSILVELMRFFGDAFIGYPDIRKLYAYRCSVHSRSSLLFYPDGRIVQCGKLYASKNYKELSGLALYNDTDMKKAGIGDSQLLDVVTELCNECVKCNLLEVCGGKCPLAKESPCTNEREEAELYIAMAMKKKEEEKNNEII